MRALSYMRVQGELVPIEIEVSLVPGLPQIIFLGLPDAAIKESVLRVKSALRHQGYKTPRAHQVLVHLRPSHLRKTSRGLDLAVAAAILWETAQQPLPAWRGKMPVIYGELSLKGEILRPDDLSEASAPFEGRAVVTGPGEAHPALETLTAPDLRGLPLLTRVPAHDSTPLPVRPEASRPTWPPAAARLLAAIAAGEHACVIAGPPGSGKTTLAESVSAFLTAPSREEQRVRARESGSSAEPSSQSWRPRIQPHHSITPLAMIGAGNPPRPGEITRAHGGVLVLDELLEFHPSIQDALREPLESGSIRLSRAGGTRTFPARFAMVATTNLCPCGHFDPFAAKGACRCSGTRRTRYLQRLSGPFLDRADILAFSGDWRRQGPNSVPSCAILESVGRATGMRAARGQPQPNGRTDLGELAATLSCFEREQIVARPFGSARRSAAILRVARTLADLDGVTDVSSQNWSQAMRWSACSFERLEAAR